jgi:tetratricopeptide (TPR) repeat protein
MRAISIPILTLLFLLPPVSSLALNPYKASRLNQKGVEALDRGDYQEAIDCFKQALGAFSRNLTIKKNLAVAYNNYALSLAQEGDYDKAIEQLQLAIELETGEKIYNENISRLLSEKAYQLYKQKRISKSQEAVNEAIRYDPENVNALLLAGEISYFNQDLKQAEDYWRRTLILNPDLEVARQRLDKLKKELPIENELKGLEGYDFEVRLDQDYRQFDAYRIRQNLREIYREIGYDFNYRPDYKIVVLIYSEEDFRRIKTHKANPWIAGVYDGKIRIPIRPGLTDQTQLLRTLRHEYTHLLVYDLAGENCPIWLNEGLAKYEETKGQSASLAYLEDVLKGKRKLIPLHALSETLRNSTDKNEIALAYEQAHSIVAYLIERYGFYRIRRLLNRLKEGEDFSTALQREFYLNLERLQSQWLEDLND